MKEIIVNHIDWENLNDLVRQSYFLDIEKVVLSKKNKMLKITLLVNFIIPFHNLEKIKKHIVDQLAYVEEVEFTFNFKDILITKDELIELYVPYLLNNQTLCNSYISKTISKESYEFQDHKLCFYALGEGIVETLNEKVSPKIQQELKDKFDLDLKVAFLNDYNLYNQYLEEEKITAEAEILEQVASTPKEKVKEGLKTQFKENKEKKKGNRIFGPTIKGSVEPINELQQDNHTAVIKGELIYKEYREIKSGKILVILALFDGTGTIGVKLFVSKEKIDQIKDNLEVNDYYKISGKITYDTYDRCLSIIGNGIEQSSGVKRTEKSREKRVELHAHTKMSSMDGIADVDALIKQASEWGHPAIAITDHGVVQAFPDAMQGSKKYGIKVIYGMEGYVYDDAQEPDIKKAKRYHIILLAKNKIGLKNLYKLVSISHMQYFYKKPNLPKSLILEHKEGLLIGSACQGGEVFQCFLNQAPEEELLETAKLYDYFEIQPTSNNDFLVRTGRLESETDIEVINKKIIALAEQQGKPVVATSDCHYIHPEDGLCRNVLQAGMGYTDIVDDIGLYFRTTDEMLNSFPYLEDALVKTLVIDNPNKIADEIEVILPIPKETFPPSIEGSEEILRNSCWQTAKDLYGEDLPEVVTKRLDRELESIISNGYAVMYVISQKLVKKSLDDGYLVGSRGSVGSSFAATMSGITEVNPLPPHYICKTCKHSEFILDGSYSCGADLPDKVCPHCGSIYDKEGFDIPFEVFLGFEGDKEPDIDLNFAGAYQSEAHKYTEVLFGKEYVYRAGTIGTLADKTSTGFVLKYFDEKNKAPSKWEVSRVSKKCEGIKRTTGQHPGGVMIVPEGMDIHEFTPIQYPANDKNSGVITTHFDYHSISGKLLKLDILGHDVPTMIKMLEDLTGVDPLKISLQDEKVNELFLSNKSLNLVCDDFIYDLGTLGIPEFGTRFVRQMVKDTKPTNFSDLIRISGLSHGTDVWTNNAQVLIANKTAVLKDVISTRDDILNFLILKGCPNKAAFDIMENVRKGKGLKEEQEVLLAEIGIPDWYIKSCQQIKYMFPKAHAVAYVMMSYRIAYFKVYYPLAFYSVFFKMKITDFDADTISKGREAILEKMEFIENKGRDMMQKDKNEYIVLELAYEMYSRGFDFMPVDLEHSKSTTFEIEGNKLRMPFMALGGVSENIANLITTERQQAPFVSIDDMRKRAKVNKTALEALSLHGVTVHLPETNQLSFI